MTTRVLIVDDHALFREGVVSTLESEPDFEVVGQAATSDAAMDAALRLRPDLILLDLYMPGRHGLSVLPLLHEALPDTRVVMLTVSEDPDAVTQALRDGVTGYLVKGIRADAFLEALRGIVAGESYVSPSVAGHILRGVYRGRTENAGLDALTDREHEVLQLIAQGLTNRDIADSLMITERTVKRHVTGILSKMKVRNRTEAALRAVEDQGRVPYHEKGHWEA